MLPNDPVMLLSFVNTQLRDNYSDIEELCSSYDTSLDYLNSKLNTIDYYYSEEKNQFV